MCAGRTTSSERRTSKNVRNMVHMRGGECHKNPSVRAPLIQHHAVASGYYSAYIMDPNIRQVR